jgi:hypothetical protein
MNKTKPRVTLMEDQETYCRDCVMFCQGCNVLLQSGEECLEKEVG